jgi:hypothetical protein
MHGISKRQAKGESNMADDSEDTSLPDVSVSTAANKPQLKPYQGMSPLRAGLMYGGAASMVMGPLGILVGLGAGITAKRMKDNYLDNQAREMRAFGGETAGLNDEIDSQSRVSDPDTKRLLDHAKLMNANGWYRLQSGDESGRELIAQSQSIVQGIMQGNRDQFLSDQAAAHQFQRGLVTTAANDYRSQFQQNAEQATNIDQQAMRVLEMANDPEFDPDKPANKAVLAQLVSTGVNGLYKDAPDVFDAVGQGTEALSHIPVVGGAAKDIAGGILTYMKSQDFKVTKEDWNRIALNMKSFNTNYTQKKFEQLGQQADNLNTFAQKQGMLPQDYSMRQYVSGGVKNLNFLPAPNVPTAAPKRTAAATGGPNYTGAPSSRTNFVQPGSFKPVTIQDAGGDQPWNQAMRFGTIQRPTN